MLRYSTKKHGRLSTCWVTEVNFLTPRWRVLLLFTIFCRSQINCVCARYFLYAVFTSVFLCTWYFKQMTNSENTSQIWQMTNVSFILVDILNLILRISWWIRSENERENNIICGCNLYMYTKQSIAIIFGYTF